MKRMLILGALIASGAMLASSSQADEKQAVANLGAPAPAFSLPDQDGRTVSLADSAGKIVVLEWFNEDCPFVQRQYSAGQMNRLADEYAAKGVVWLAVNSTKGKSPETNKKAATDWKMDRPILADPAGNVGHLFGATNTPGMFIINKDGTLAYSGAIDDNMNGDKKDAKNYVAQALDQLLAGQSVSEPQTKQYGCTVKYAK